MGTAENCDAGGTPKTCTQRGEFVKSRFPLASFCLAFLLASALGQTYDINGQNGTPAPPGKSQKAPDTDAAHTSSNPGPSDLGWGSSIEVARQARAAQDALKRNDYA